MLIRCKIGISAYSDPFLLNLCLEGWLLHARRIIEVFRLDAVDKKGESNGVQNFVSKNSVNSL